MIAKVLSTNYRHSQVAGGLEIPCKFIVTTESVLIETLKTLIKVSGISPFSKF